MPIRRLTDAEKVVEFRLQLDEAKQENARLRAEVERLRSALWAASRLVSITDRNTLSLAFTTTAGFEELASLTFACSHDDASCIWDALTREGGDSNA